MIIKNEELELIDVFKTFSIEESIEIEFFKYANFIRREACCA